jgi:hypothetical protein
MEAILTWIPGCEGLGYFDDMPPFFFANPGAWIWYSAVEDLTPEDLQVTGRACRDFQAGLSAFLDLFGANLDVAAAGVFLTRLTGMYSRICLDFRGQAALNASADAAVRHVARPIQEALTFIGNFIDKNKPKKTREERRAWKRNKALLKMNLCRRSAKGADSSSSSSSSSTSSDDDDDDDGGDDDHVDDGDRNNAWPRNRMKNNRRKRWSHRQRRQKGAKRSRPQPPKPPLPPRNNRGAKPPAKQDGRKKGN